MPIKYVCDRCDDEAISTVRIISTTAHGTSTGDSTHYLCVKHARELHVAVTKGGARAK